jgi:hypothetical protein
VCATTPCLAFFGVGSHWLFAWVGLEPWFSHLCLPKSVFRGARLWAEQAGLLYTVFIVIGWGVIWRTAKSMTLSQKLWWIERLYSWGLSAKHISCCWAVLLWRGFREVHFRCLPHSSPALGTVSKPSDQFQHYFVFSSSQTDPRLQRRESLRPDSYILTACHLTDGASHSIQREPYCCSQECAYSWPHQDSPTKF